MEIFTDPRCLGHRVPSGFPEVPDRLQGILAGLGWGGRIHSTGAHADTRERLGEIHGASYIERFEAAVRRGDGIFDSADNPLVADTFQAAWGAVEATLHAADRVAAGVATLAAVRPPGHHAERSQAMGFCYFNNVAVAAEHLRQGHGCARIAIFDFDVHHGNGTQHIFEEDPDVFYASTHQYPFYPGTGAADEIGRGRGRGATLNVPLPSGQGDGEYEEAIRGLVIPALERFAPQALLISAGFDAWRGDPLGGMGVSEQGFRRWGEWLGELAEACCDGRLLAVLEGGYDLEALPRLVAAFVAGVSAHPEQPAD